MGPPSVPIRIGGASERSICWSHPSSWWRWSRFPKQGRLGRPAGTTCGRSSSALPRRRRDNMCGIAGIFDLRGKPVEQQDISRLTDLLAHRGPWGEGFWFNFDRSLAFGHRRLAIIDPTASGYQPMLSDDARHVIVFNGEIYNFLELRRELEREGAIFRSQSDTEVILAAWRRWGEGMLTRFNGMWALAIYDTTKGELFLARDRFGIKPLLYAASPARFVFASEQRAIVRSALVGTSLDIEVARCLMFDAFAVRAAS